MGTHRKPSSAKRFAVEAALGGMMAVGVAVGSAGFASADPGDPPAPPAPPPGASLLAGGDVPAGAVVDAPPPVNPAVTAFGPLGAVSGGGAAGMLLGQNPVPSVDGSGAVPVNQSQGVLDAGQFLSPMNYRMPDYDPDSLSPYALTEGTPPGPFARVDAWKGAHALAHGGIGRMPIGDLGQPLPGTAPPPGTNIPVGPMDVDPAAPAPGFLPPIAPLPLG